MLYKISYKHTNSGFTLIELLVSIAISGIVLVTLTQLFMSTNKIYTVQDNITNMQQDVRAALNIMAHDIRMAGFKSGTINATNSTKFSFSMENSTGGLEYYGYEYDQDDKTINYLHPGIGSYQKLTEIESIDSLQFSYLPSSSDPRTIIVEACGKISGAFEEDFNNTYCFKKRIKCRNMGLD